MGPGPLGPEHAFAPATAAWIAKLHAAARMCGVTRLADVTRLDRIGLPVWQAVRPAGRSLSVHQGKGPIPEAAIISALCEAIEAHSAEQAAADGPLCSFADLPPDARAGDISDYCSDRRVLPTAGATIQWSLGSDLLTGGGAYLPHALVSLDYTRDLPCPFERTSAGLGAGPRHVDALRTALYETVERDAVGEWLRQEATARNSASIRPETIPFDWLREWHARLAELDIELRVYQINSPVGIPVFMAVISGAEAFGPAFRRFHGTAAYHDPEIALFKALAEAVQSRLTFIAGVRDDIMPSDYARPPPELRRAGGSPAVQSWNEIGPADGTIEAVAERLAGLGFRRIVTKRLNEALDGVAVVRVFVPGFGSLTRSRRADR